MSTRDELRAALLRETQITAYRVDVPNVGTFYVREMTGEERDQFDGLTAKLRDQGRENVYRFRARLLAMTVTDAEGKRLFGADDVEALAGVRASVLEPLVDEALNVNGLSEASAKGLEKN